MVQGILFQALDCPQICNWLFVFNNYNLIKFLTNKVGIEHVLKILNMER